MIVIDQWAGLVTNASPYAITSSAAVTQVNLQVISPGQLTVRPGLNAISFTSHTGGTSPIRRAFWYPGSRNSIVYITDDGSVRAAFSPT